MKSYKVRVIDNRTLEVVVEAENEEEAQAIVEGGEFRGDDLFDDEGVRIATAETPTAEWYVDDVTEVSEEDDDGTV